MAVKNWNPQKLKRHILDALESNGAIVGKVVEESARSRLLAITDPEWGSGYRRLVAMWMLTSEVERMGNMIEIRVGVTATNKSRFHGFYIETGSSTAPAQPFLRPAVFGNAGTIVALLEG